METATFSTARVAELPGGRLTVSHGDDAMLIVEFYMQPILQGFASERAGKEVWKDEPYIWIRFPGDRTKDRRRPVQMQEKNGVPGDPDRWPTQWRQFQNQQIQTIEGTPLEKWPTVGKSTALNLKAYNVHTVEQLAVVPDSVIHNLGTGADKLRKLANDWLKAAESNAVVTKLEAELAKRDADIEGMKAQIAELSKALSKKNKD